MMDLDALLRSQVTRRTQDVPVPELAEFFEDDAPHVWTVRQLTAAELGACVEQAKESTQENIREFISAVAGSGEKGEAFSRISGLSLDQVPEDVSRRMGELTIGAVSPELGTSRRDVVLRLAEDFPLVFFRLTNVIRALTDAGAEVGKQKRSGATPESAPL